MLTAVGLLAAVVILLGGASSTRADSDCAAAFERWSKVSATRTRKQNAVTGTQEACLLNEATRADLLQALAKRAASARERRGSINRPSRRWR